MLGTTQEFDSTSSQTCEGTMISKIRCTLLSTCAALIFFNILSIRPALALDEMTQAIDQLNTQIEIIESMKFYVERKDLARLIVLEKSATHVIDTLHQNGLANMLTIRAYQEMLLSYQYSQSFFKQVSTKSTEKSISDLMAINAAISKARGFDQSPYLTMIANILNNMNTLADQLNQLPVDENLKKNVVALKPEMGRAIALARQGDRPKAFAAGISISKKLMGLYPLFNAVMASDEAFNVIMELQGLNELFAEYAQMDDKDDPSNEVHP